MKNLKVFLVLIVTVVACAFQGSEPWTADQLMQPADLAVTLNNSKAPQPLVYSIGPSGGIRNSIDIGPTRDAANVEKLRAALSGLSRDTSVVIYCGCCPFVNCPNIRPAFRLLNEMKFTHAKLLDLKKNLKTDWIDQGYPMNSTR